MCKTDYGGGGGKNFPKIDYVICEQPLIGLQPIKTRAELDSSTVLKQIFYEYHPLNLELRSSFTV